eukprot:gene22644-27338_t
MNWLAAKRQKFARSPKADNAIESHAGKELLPVADGSSTSLCKYRAHGRDRQLLRQSLYNDGRADAKEAARRPSSPSARVPWRITRDELGRDSQ